MVIPMNRNHLMESHLLFPHSIRRMDLCYGKVCDINEALRWSPCFFPIIITRNSNRIPALPLMSGILCITGNPISFSRYYY